MTYNVYVVAIAATLVLIVLRELVRHRVRTATNQLVIAALAANLASYVLAAAVAFGVFVGHGITTGVRDVVQGTLPGYDAATRLRPGDVILAVDHEPMSSGSFSDRVARKNGAAVTLTIERAGVTTEVSVTPRRSTEDDTHRWLLGIKRGAEPIQSRDVGAALGAAAAFPAGYVRFLAGEIGERFVGGERADPGGPARMIEEFRIALVQRGFLVELGSLWMRFAVFAMLLMFVVDIVRVTRIARLAAREGSAGHT